MQVQGLALKGSSHVYFPSLGGQLPRCKKSPRQMAGGLTTCGETPAGMRGHLSGAAAGAPGQTLRHEGPQLLRPHGVGALTRAAQLVHKIMRKCVLKNCSLSW